MDRIRTIEAFLAVARTGGFARAARALGVSPPVVTRAVSELEARLGVRLVNRTTRHVRLTDTGLAFAESARRALVELEAAEAGAAGERVVPSGLLTLGASVTFGRAVLRPVVEDFLAGHPQVSVRLVLADRVMSLVEEGLDLAVRIADLPDSALIARPAGRVQRVLVASPAYLKRAGSPRSPADLARHTLIHFSAFTPVEPLGAFAAAPRLTVNDAAAAIAAAESGLGITEALSYMVADSLAARRLRRILPAASPPPVGVHLVYPGARAPAPKTRAFIEFALPRLAQRLTMVARTLEGRSR
jgi:DNA-binding transcriptional LysR family regulator